MDKKTLLQFLPLKLSPNDAPFLSAFANSEYPRIFQVTGANQNALLSTDLVNTNIHYYPYGHVPPGELFLDIVPWSEKAQYTIFLFNNSVFQAQAGVFLFFLSILGLKILMTFLRCYCTQQIVNMQNTL